WWHCVTNDRRAGTHSIQGGSMFDSFLQDLRYGIRSLTARPAFAIAALLTLALAIGANTLVFSLIDGIYLTPLPYRDDARLVDVENRYPSMGLDTTGADRVVVLGDAMWRNRYNADPGIVGRDIRLNGESYEVVGVMPRGFMFPNRETELYVPFAFTPKQKSDLERGYEFSTSVARLAPS